MARTLRILLAYDGTGFVGWQRQAAGRSVQGVLEEALGRIEGHPVSVVGAGRTDAGVHALGQVASCSFDHPIAPADLHRALNAILPADVRLLRVGVAEEGFHARYSARGKTYRYVLFNSDVVSPFLARYGWHIPQRLDVCAMREAAALLIGHHDFSAFRSAGSAVKTSDRTMTTSLVREAAAREAFGLLGADAGAGGEGGVPLPVVIYEVSGDGFLRHMVRAVVGSLVEVGSGRRTPAWFASVLESRDRDAAGPTAPAEGLFLVSVRY